MRRDELSRLKLRTCLAAARPHIAIFRLAIPQLRHHLVFTIENTDLAIKIRTHHPPALGMEVAGHPHVLLVFDCLQMGAVKREDLNSSIATISHGQKRRFSTGVNPKTMRSLKLALALPRLADLTEKFSVQRIAQYVARTVTIPHVEITTGSERNVGRHEVNRSLAITRVFPRIAVDPDFFTRKCRLHHTAAIDIAMIEKLFFSFAPQFQSVRSSTKALTERANKPTFRIKYDNRLAAHARLVNRMPDVNVSLLILAKPMCISPYQSFRWNQPVMHTLVAVRSGTHNGESGSRLVGGLKVKPRREGRS